jgi:hypothetical protein
MKTRSVYLSVALLLVVCITGCANLEHINTFATLSEKALSAETDIGYSYSQSCEEFNCKVSDSIGLYYYPVTAEQMKAAFIDTPKCNCKAFENADNALTTINSMLSAYFTGLANLSDSKAVNYNYNDLVSAINTNATKLSFSADEVTAFGNIATILSNDLMNTYRRNKLKVIIKKADPDIQIVLSAYIKQMQSFRDVVLKGDLQFLANWYSGYLTDNSGKLSPYEKGKIYQDYLDQKAKIINYQTLTTSFISSLQTIKAGHAAMVKDAGQLTAANVKEIINAYSADIFSLISQFNKLKTSNN